MSQKTMALKVGDKKKLTASVTPAGASAVKFASDKNDVATVDDSGNVTAVKEGTANITATAGDKTDKCVVTVSAAG